MSQELSEKVHRAITELFIRRINLVSSKAKKCMRYRENNVLKEGRINTHASFKHCVKKL